MSATPLNHLFDAIIVGGGAAVRRASRSPSLVEMSVALDWLIIGGGIHGVHIAARLLGEADVSPDRLRLVDPGDRLLARWHTCTEVTGMSHLRSPAVHHLDLDPAIPSCIELIGGAWIDSKPERLAAFRPKSARRSPA